MKGNETVNVTRYEIEAAIERICAYRATWKGNPGYARSLDVELHALRAAVRAEDDTQALRRALSRVRLWVEAIREQIEQDTGAPALGCRQTVDEIDEAVRCAPVAQPTHRHIKSGGEYRVIGRGLIEATLADVVIYEASNGKLWVRPSEEFDDGRFQPL